MRRNIEKVLAANTAATGPSCSFILMSQLLIWDSDTSSTCASPSKCLQLSKSLTSLFFRPETHLQIIGSCPENCKYSSKTLWPSMFVVRISFLRYSYQNEFIDLLLHGKADRIGCITWCLLSFKLQLFCRRHNVCFWSLMGSIWIHSFFLCSHVFFCCWTT